MARRKSDQPNDEGVNVEGSSPAIEAIDPRQVEANNLTATPDEDDNRAAGDAPDPKDNPALPNDVSNTADPNDPMTLTGKDAEPGENGQ